MTSLERVLAALGQSEPDRVPFFMAVTMHGAQELGMTIKEYFSRPENVAEAQVRMRVKYRDDFLYNFTYASAEVEAWGGETLFCDDGPPNAAEPFIRIPSEILSLEAPRVAESPSLRRVLRATELMREKAGDGVPIVGVVMAPFSLPVMELGFERYLELLYEEPDLFERLMCVNEEFCVEWANAQLDAGATAIGYFDPVSSPTIVPRDLYLTTGREVAGRTLPRINGPTATLLASGSCIPIIDDICATGTAMVSVGSGEDLAEAKRVCSGRLTVMGNLNAIEMRRWSAADAEAAVKHAIARGAQGGGFILCDTHGEIPWQVPEDVLLAVSDAVHTWGRYPVDWVTEGMDV